MSLKPDRRIVDTEIGYFMNEAANPGKIVSVNTAPSGADLDTTDAVATVEANSSGADPLGVLLTQVVDIDLTRQPVNWNKDQAVTGDKVAIMNKGWCVTDQVDSASAGEDAVLASSGQVMTKNLGSHNEAANPTVGRFRSDLDEDGYARLYVDL